MMILPYSIKEFRVRNFQGIKDTSLKDLPATAPWIFITGRNGYGKTSLLRGLSIGLYGKIDSEDDDRRLAGKEVDIELKINKRNKDQKGTIPRIMKKELYSEVAHLAYGPVRIPSGRKRSKPGSNVKSLFSSDGDILYDFENELFDLHQEESNKYLKDKNQIIKDYTAARDLLLELTPQFSDEFESNDFVTPAKDKNKNIEELKAISKKDHFVGKLLKKNNISINSEHIKLWSQLKDQYQVFAKEQTQLPKFNIVRQFLLELMDNIKDIRVDEDKLYFFEKEQHTEAKSIDQLASGNRMLFTWVGDMLMRLKYKESESPKELKGIVIIDEFDLHLHPVWQKKLPGILSANLPNIQFVASTHSPIPLLGAPKGSVFLKVNRSEDAGIYVTRLDDKIYFDELLPNTLLTSPVFEMEDIFSSEFKGEKAPRTETDYSELNLNNILDKKIDDFLTDKKESDLIRRIKNKRES